MKSTVLYIGLFVGALIALGAAGFASFASETFNLQCDLTASNGLHRYAFRVEVPTFIGTARIRWVGVNTHDLDIVRVDETTIIAQLKQKLHGWPEKADVMSFQFNRLSGAGDVSYLQNPPAPDPKDPWSLGLPVLTEFSETGKCYKTERVF
jgi:hypothetical protein